MTSNAITVTIPLVLLLIYSILEIVCLFWLPQQKKLLFSKMFFLFGGLIAMAIILMTHNTLIQDFDKSTIVYAHNRCARVSHLIYKILAGIYLILYTPVYNYLRTERLTKGQISLIHDLKGSFGFRLILTILAFIAGVILFATSNLGSMIIYGPENTGIIGNIILKIFLQ